MSYDCKKEGTTATTNKTKQNINKEKEKSSNSVQGDKLIQATVQWTIEKKNTIWHVRAFFFFFVLFVCFRERVTGQAWFPYDRYDR